MKIAESSVTLASDSIAGSKREVRETLRAWVGNTRPDFEGKGSTRTSAPSIQVNISDSARAAQSSEMKSINDVESAVENDPRMQLIKMIVEFMTGKKISVVHASDIAQSAVATPTSSQTVTQASAQQPKAAGYGVEYDYHASYSESASMAFAGSGIIKTQDGQEIKFDISLQKQRSYSEETNVSMRAGDVKKVDPLVIIFSGNAAQLTDQRFSFDLNADGKNENIQFVQGGGFLALDRNSDGKINNGKELFGPATGNSFAELQALDSDGNHWIDENDAAYQQLKIWTKDSAGKDMLAGLKESNVGALYIGNVSSPFAIKDEQNNLQAQVRSTGIWLSDSGSAGSMQQVDLVA